MNRNAIRIIIIIGIFVITCIIAVQAFWVKQAFDIKEKEFKTSANKTLEKVASHISSIYGLQEIDHPVSQISDDYFVVNLRAPLDQGLLEHYLKEELKKNELLTDFEYGIYDCDTDQIVYGAYITSDFKVDQTKPNILPKSDQFLNYFGVKFPKKKEYINSNLEFWFISSLATLIITAFFGYALFVILKQKRLSDVQRDFMNNMTHEFQTPISTIKIASEVIMNDKILENPARLKKYAEIINQENNRLKNQVESVLTTARVGRGKLELKLEEFDFHEVLLEVTESVKLELGEQLNYDLRANNHLIKADKVHTKNVIRNLLDNAIKYSDDKINITLKTLNQDNNLNFEVIDMGMGIPENSLKKIFDKFYRVPTGNVHNVKGFGLGLNYVKLIVNGHKWLINVKSKLKEGTTFTISIPTIK